MNTSKQTGDGIVYLFLGSLIGLTFGHPLTDDECLEEELIVDHCHPCRGNSHTGNDGSPLQANASDVIRSLCYVSSSINNISDILHEEASRVEIHGESRSLLPLSIQTVFFENEESSLNKKTYRKITAITAALKIATDFNRVSINLEYRGYERYARNLLCNVRKYTHRRMHFVCKLYAIYPNSINTSSRKLKYIWQAVVASKQVINGLKNEWRTVTGIEC